MKKVILITRSTCYVIPTDYSPLPRRFQLRLYGCVVEIRKKLMKAPIKNIDMKRVKINPHIILPTLLGPEVIFVHGFMHFVGYFKWTLTQIRRYA